MKTILNVEGMMCSHCENRVTTVLSAIEGVTSVAVDLEAKTVTANFPKSSYSAPPNWCLKYA